MDSPLHLKHEFSDHRKLAHCVVERFEQLLIFIPMMLKSAASVSDCAMSTVPKLGTKLRIDLTLPDSPQTVLGVCADVRCVLRSPSTTNNTVWLGIIVRDDHEGDIEQRIRRLTHAISHEYGSIMLEIFA